MTRLRDNDTVRLRRECRGLHPKTDLEVTLPVGSVGTVIESMSPATVIVEFLSADGDVRAWASIDVEHLERTGPPWD